jgi:asparagine synthetase B (glutamine-hydrolysing)
MCGIAGAYHANSKKDVKRMTEQLRHRGPNGFGVTNAHRAACPI